MDIPKFIAQWTALHDACLAEAQTLIDVPGNEAVIHSLASTALLCVDAMRKFYGEPQPIHSVRDLVYGDSNRSDIP